MGSLVPEAAISQAFEDESLGGFVFDGVEVFWPEFHTVSLGRPFVAVDRLVQVRQVARLGLAVAVRLERKMEGAEVAKGAQMPYSAHDVSTQKPLDYFKAK